MTAEPQTSESTEQTHVETTETHTETGPGQGQPDREQSGPTPEPHEAEQGSRANEERTATKGETSAAANLPWDPTDPSIPRTGPREMDVQKKGFGDKVLT